MENDLLCNLNPDQKKAVEINSGSLLVFAGAGSGKTRVITTKIAYALQQGLFKPEEILAVTFTNKACNEMRTRVAGMVGKTLAANVMIKTFHSFGVWFLRKFPLAAGLEPDFQMYDEADCRSMLHQCFPNESKKDIAEMADIIAMVKDQMQEPDKRILKYYNAYQRRLRATNHIDFADMIIKPIEALKSDESVRKYVHGRFKMILVDEYQDSNRAQALLLRLLAGPDAFVCVVGDDDQSIYRFRGADVGNILAFKNKFDNVQVVTLGTNYRCTAPILEVAKDVICNNTNRAKKRLLAARPDGKLPEMYVLRDDYSEADFVISMIQEIGDYGNTAIEYRNNWLSKIFEEKLMKARIPYHIVGNVGFYDREEVKDALAYLSLCLNHKDAVAFKRIINKPLRGIGDRSSIRVIEEAENHDMDVIAACAAIGQKEKRGSRLFTSLLIFKNLIEKYSDVESFHDNSEWLHGLLSDSGLLKMYVAKDEIERTQRCGNLSQLVTSLTDERFRHGKEGVLAFLEDVALTRSATKDNGNGVTLITMHSTKGLEFKRVFVVGMEDTIIPPPRSASDDEMEFEQVLEEERRLCYVAFTRAKDELYITRADSRRIWGKTVYSNPSPFLEEIQEDHVRCPIPKYSNIYGF